MGTVATGFERDRQRHVRAFAERLSKEAERLTWPLERLHSLRDERLRALLRTAKKQSSWHAERLATVRQVIARDRVGVIVEFVFPERMTEDPGLLPAALLDLIMLAYAGGRERTETELSRLLDEAGLRLERASALTSGPHLLQAVVA